MTSETEEENLRRERVNTGAALVVEADADPSASDSFAEQLQQTLRETEGAVLDLAHVRKDPSQSQHWQHARAIVERFKPTPWFIWRLSNFVLGRAGVINEAPEGLVFGLRRLLFAAASDGVLGAGQKINNARRALNELDPDVLAAVAVIHGMCRRLGTFDHERIWRPILEDALVRSRIGFMVGAKNPEFGSGRGMLAGFAGRCGLAILIATGDLDQARRALEMLASGTDIRDVGLAVYRCEPLQVSAMTLSAAGCGRDAAFGTVSFSAGDALGAVDSTTQLQWLAAFTIIERTRVGRESEIDARLWDALGFGTPEAQKELVTEVKQLVRRGHGWGWLV